MCIQNQKITVQNNLDQAKQKVQKCQILILYVNINTGNKMQIFVHVQIQDMKNGHFNNM